jgi:hypothetical protein
MLDAHPDDAAPPWGCVGSVDVCTSGTGDKRRTRSTIRGVTNWKQASVDNSDLDPLMSALMSLTGALLGGKRLTQPLQPIVRLATQLIDGCSGASISLLVEGKPTSVAVTDRVTLEVDLVQYDNSEGPCLLALGGDVIRVAFVPTDERFPHFAIGATDRRVLSTLSIPIRSNETMVAGTLNLYSNRQDGFGIDAETTALVLSAEAGVIITTSDVYNNAVSTAAELQQRHDDDAAITVAQGILMALQECSATQAMNLIRYASDTNAETLVEVARRIVDAVRQPDICN